MTKFVCPKCRVVFDSEFTDEFELHMEQDHQDYLAEHEDFNAYDHVLESEIEEELEPEQLGKADDKKEKILSEVEKSLETPLDKQVKDMKKEMIHDYLKDRGVKKASDSNLLRHTLMEFLANRKRIFDMYCVKHPERQFSNKGEYISHLKECQPTMLSRYERLYESLTKVKELKLRLPDATAENYGQLAKDFVEYAMTVENVTTKAGSQEPEHETVEVIDEGNLEQCSKEVDRTEEMLSAEARKLGIEFQNGVPLKDQTIVLAFLKERKRRKEEQSKKKESLGDMSLGYQGHA